MNDISPLILKRLATDDAYCRKVIPYLKSEYFESKDRIVYLLLKQYLITYHKLPSRVALEYEFAQSKYNTAENGAVVPELIARTYDTSDEIDNDWLVANTETWCQERAIYLGVMKAISILDGREKDITKGAIPDILTKALAVSFDSNVGHDYFENYKHRYEYYHQEQYKIPCDLELLNTITNGGISRKTLNIILAGCVHPTTKIRVRLRKSSSDANLTLTDNKLQLK
jgi:hypothetical protein